VTPVLKVYKVYKVTKVFRVTLVTLVFAVVKDPLVVRETLVSKDYKV
jgi:hypothetical protein